VEVWTLARNWGHWVDTMEACTPIQEVASYDVDVVDSQEVLDMSLEAYLHVEEEEDHMVLADA
jgi:hypothetical protein